MNRFFKGINDFVNLKNWVKVLLIPLTNYALKGVSEMLMGLIIGGVLMSLMFDFQQYGAHRLFFYPESKETREVFDLIQNADLD